MMAAGRAGELGARVVLLEKNKDLGVKLLATGNGRCNITNKTDGLRAMAAKFGKNGKFLFSSLNKFRPEDVIGFFEGRGVKTKMEDANRVFPASDKARDVLNALTDHLKEFQVEIKTSAGVKEIVKKNSKIEKAILLSGEEIIADKFIIATGGKAYPLTGSAGDGYGWLKKSGHTITELRPALVPILIKEKIVKELEGLSLADIGISIYKDNKKIGSMRGEAIFTAEGLSGPVILDMSREIGKALPGKVGLRIDFEPEMDFTELDQKMQKDFQEEGGKMLKNSLDRLLPKKLVPVIIRLAGIDPEKKANSVTKEERKKITHLLKEFRLEVKDLAGYDRANVTSGGIKLSEVDPRTMRSKLIDNLYFAGEILDLDGPTGGYNLQVSWSTGYAAGESAARKEEAGQPRRMDQSKYL